MIRIPEHPLPAPTAQKLKRYQHKIDEQADFSLKVSLAKREFANKNKNTNQTFISVRHTLHEMCSGSRRCMYCEDSCADEVEHFKPKDTYPDYTFIWENYLYACGPCNGGKSNQFAVFDAKTQAVVNVARRSTDPVIPPIEGMPVLIDPRADDPMVYIALDLRNTFAFQPFPGILARDLQRAQQTIKIFDLNRDVLLKARSQAYGSYRARLREYIALKAKGAPPDDLAHLQNALAHLPHPTVWREMQRQHELISELKSLFQQAPEAQSW